MQILIFHQSHRKEEHVITFADLSSYDDEKINPELLDTTLNNDTVVNEAVVHELYSVPRSTFDNEAVANEQNEAVVNELYSVPRSILDNEAVANEQNVAVVNELYSVPRSTFDSEAVVNEAAVNELYLVPRSIPVRAEDEQTQMNVSSAVQTGPDQTKVNQLVMTQPTVVAGVVLEQEEKSTVDNPVYGETQKPPTQHSGVVSVIQTEPESDTTHKPLETHRELVSIY